jgi:hypothetical protein
MKGASVSVTGLLSTKPGELSRLEVRFGQRAVKLVSDSPHGILDALGMVARVLETGELPEHNCEHCEGFDTCELPEKYAHLTTKKAGK